MSSVWSHSDIERYLKRMTGPLLLLFFFLFASACVNTRGIAKLLCILITWALIAVSNWSEAKKPEQLE